VNLAIFRGYNLNSACRLGGVHRGGENCSYSVVFHLELYVHSFYLALDISADLHELTRCPVGLVSSGVKSILDIKR